MKQRTLEPGLALLLVLSLGHFTVDMHAGSLPTLFPTLREAYGISYAQVGFLMLVSQITSSVIQPLFGLVSDRVSTRWLLPLSLVVATSGLLLIGSAQTYPTVMLGVIVMGMGIAAYHPEASKLVHFVGGERKGRAMSIFAIGGNIGIAFGPALMGLGLAMWGMRGTVLFVPVGALTFLVVMRYLRRLYSHLDSDSQVSVERKTARVESKSQTQWRTLALLLFIIFLRSGAHSSILTFIPMYYTDHLGHPGTYSSLLLTTFLLAGAVGTFIGGPASDRLGHRNVILWSLLLTTPFLFLVPMFSGGIIPVALMAVIGCTLISSFAVTTVLGQSLLANNVGLASGLTLGFSVGTGGVTATLLGWVADGWGLSVALIAIALLTLAGGVMAMWLPQGKSARPSVQMTTTAAGK